jgi:hypothetical protein
MTPPYHCSNCDASLIVSGTSLIFLAVVLLPQLLLSVFGAAVILRDTALLFAILVLVYYWLFHWPIVIVEPLAKSGKMGS